MPLTAHILQMLHYCHVSCQKELQHTPQSRSPYSGRMKKKFTIHLSAHKQSINLKGHRDSERERETEGWKSMVLKVELSILSFALKEND